ncbi:MULTISPECIES: glycerate kinase [unclassified Nocardioides]|uniref:glycerate kinase n=1 Tax=unclassified Nocardioides TaxID=2615069 RepID=UPI00362135EE
MPHPRRVLVAADKFKGTLTSAEVGAAVGAGLRAGVPDVQVEVVPVADGGDGTLAAAVAAGYELVPVTASGPTGRPVQSGYARRGGTAVVELADAAGLSRLPDGTPQPMTASSRGAGEVMARAVEAGCTQVVLGIGGSACTDGGAGLVRALGATVTDAQGDEIGEGGGCLDAVASLDLTGLRERMHGVEVLVACDVDNPLTGPRGAAAVYGPQKGAGAEQVARLDVALGRWADLVSAETGTDHRETPGAGAAGGVGFAALALLGATTVPGIELVLDLVGFRDRLDGADLVITGEGALDEQTLHGKAPVGVAAVARQARVPVVAVCGSNTLERGPLVAAGIEAVYPLTDVEPDLARCLRDGERLLGLVGRRIATDHLGP